jgi:hypothetical protein
VARAKAKKKKLLNRVCVMSPKQASQLRHAFTLGHRCSSRAHAHYPRGAVDALVLAGEVQWFGTGKRVVVWAEHKIWAKTRSGPVTTMQLLEPAEVYGRRRRWTEPCDKFS